MIGHIITVTTVTLKFVFFCLKISIETKYGIGKKIIKIIVVIIRKSVKKPFSKRDIEVHLSKKRP